MRKCRWSADKLCGGLLAAVVILSLAALGCEEDPPGKAKADPPGKEPAKGAEATRKQLGKNVFFEVEVKQRRVIVTSQVCLREGQLEGLLCRKNTKEHEYILAADVDARLIHTALIAAGGKPGSPTRWVREKDKDEIKVIPPTGSRIKVTLQYQKDGKTIAVNARDWIRDIKDKKKTLDVDWVFAGSKFVPDEKDKDQPPYYLANQGDVICVCNMPDAMLDLPIESPKTLEARIFVAATEKIPALGTLVDIIFEVVPDTKEKGDEKGK